VHEDDALRAVRAADEIRRGVSHLKLQVWIGVNTGEVVAGEGGTLVTGDAVNVAPRLEQAAPPGQLLVGKSTERLVRDWASLEQVEPLALKGRLSRFPPIACSMCCGRSQLSAARLTPLSSGARQSSRR
jgi:class 3 adenylate cyclase